jgi:DNA replication and repair protein RecF
MALVDRLNAAVSSGVMGGFPRVRIGLGCAIAERLGGSPALAVEEWLRRSLAANRARDAAAGGAALGAHRTDMRLADASGTPAEQASTGEQKAMLVGLVLAHAALIAEARGFAPLLLLDEPAVHLDPARRAALFEALLRLPAQAMVTGTDAETFQPLRGHAELLRTGGGALTRDVHFPAPETACSPVPDTL